MSKSLGLSRHVLGASTTVTRGLACISQCHIQPLASITFCQPTRDNTLSTAHTKAAVVEPTSALALAQARSIHTSASTENPLIVGGIAVAAGAIAVRYGMEAYQSWAAKRKSSVADVSKYYKGDFEDEMSLREASRILGVRESASKERIRERYKRLLVLNHPDRGGSTFLAGKINEANEILTRGK